jgi:hypothetical protein
MTKAQCMETMLFQIVRSIVYEDVPSVTEMAKLHVFLNNLGTFEAQHPDHTSAALEDWVPRLIDGIAASSHLNTQQPPLTLQASIQQSTHYMDSMLDALATVPSSSGNPFRHEARVPEPRFTVNKIMGHKIEGGQLSYWVHWEGTDYYEAEVYKIFITSMSSGSTKLVLHPPSPPPESLVQRRRPSSTITTTTSACVMRPSVC